MFALCLSMFGCTSDDAAQSNSDADPGTDGESSEDTDTADTDPEETDTAETDTAETDTDSDTDDSEFPVPTDEVDYNSCEAGGVGDPDCDGVECAEAEYQDEVAVLLEVVEGAGLDDVFTVSRVSGFPDTDQLFINYYVHVGWFRANSSVQLRLPLTEAELRGQFEQHLANLDVPTEVAPLATVSTAISECFGFQFDPCEHNWPDFRIHVQQEGANECDDIKVAVVDLVTGETVACREESVACG